MSHPYDLSKKADMRKFENDLKQFAYDAAVEAVEDGFVFDIACPLCGEAISVPAGRNVCPACNEEFDLVLQV